MQHSSICKLEKSVHVEEQENVHINKLFAWATTMEQFTIKVPCIILAVSPTLLLFYGVNLFALTFL